MPLVRCFRSKKFEDKEGETRSTGATLWGRNRDRVEHDAVFGLLRDENGGVAQLVRAHGSYPWRHWFKSSHRYQQDLALDEPMHISKQYTLQGG